MMVEKAGMLRTKADGSVEIKRWLREDGRWKKYN